MTIKNNIVSIFDGHNCGFVVYDKTKDKFLHYEMEKICGIKNMRVFQVTPYHGFYYSALSNIESGNHPSQRTSNYKNYIWFAKQVMDIVESLDLKGETELLFNEKEGIDPRNPHGMTIMDYCYDVYPKKDYIVLIKQMLHHQAHAASAFYQSPYNRAFALTVDGGSHEGNGASHLCDENGIERIKEWNLGGGGLFNHFTWPIAAISLSSKESLDWAGKVMGLSAYGKHNQLLYSRIKAVFLKKMTITHAMAFIRSVLDPTANILDDVLVVSPSGDVIGGQRKTPKVEEWVDLRDTIRNCHGFLESEPHVKDIVLRLEELSEQLAFIKDIEKAQDLAYNLQKAFENFMIALVRDNMDHIKSMDNNLVLTGGCALNVLANQRIREEYPDINVFVPPNPNDIGLAYGYLRSHMSTEHGYEKKTPNMQYHGQEIQDSGLVHKRDYKITTYEHVAELLKEGKIIGCINGGHELGPRALGNRSIICDPSYPNMKDILNAKVKNREWYRPFAPVCKREDAEKYFESVSFDNMDYMSFACKTRDIYVKDLAAVTHVDGTARLQTITKDLNPFLYSILDAFDGVLLNTSFNINGNPILNSVKDAYWMLDNTEMDYVLINIFGRLHLYGNENI